MTDAERDRAVVLRYVEAQRSGDVSILDEVLHPDFVDRMMGVRRDRAGVARQIRDLHALLSNVRYDVGPVVSEGGWVAVQYTLTGEHTGEMPLPRGLAARLGRTSLPPTGRKGTLSGMFVARVEDGRMTSGWGEYDQLALLAQLGLLD